MKHHAQNRNVQALLFSSVAGHLDSSRRLREEAGNLSFASAEDGVAALIEAGRQGDTARLQALFGPGAEAIVSSGDEIADRTAREGFLAQYDAKHALVPEGEERVTLQVGGDDWPFPVPVVRRDGVWYFDGAEGADEIVYRRIGRNELGASPGRARSSACSTACVLPAMSISSHGWPRYASSWRVPPKIDHRYGVRCGRR